MGDFLGKSTNWHSCWASLLVGSSHKVKECDNDSPFHVSPPHKESYIRGMHERYGDNSQRLELDLDIWVVASGAPKKGHVYGFGHSLGTARVTSSCSSFVSHATSPFPTPVAQVVHLVPPRP
ncbi:hypothetical protein Taro_006504 [Colocasia esculenta]|uniref:Uncharacterized protein n=1 Tax=Colocasia esculenta TaxID=4460 RepID=A0A843TRC9_COLES|nr:hypothetical protein [Colocasia esculenta]